MHRHDDPRWLVGDAYSRVGRVDRLATGPGGAVDIDLQVALVYLHVHILGFGQHRHGGGRGVDATLGLSLRHPLNAVRATLELEDRVGILALDGKCVLALPYLQRLYLQARALRIAGEHAVDVPRPQTCLVAAGAALDFDDHVLLVVGVALDHREADLLFERLDALAGAFEQLAQLGVLTVLGDQLLSTGRIVSGPSPLLGELGGRLQLAVGTTYLGIALPIADHLGFGHLLTELGKASFDLLDQVFDHAGQSMWPGATPPRQAAPRTPRSARVMRRARPRPR